MVCRLQFLLMKKAVAGIMRNQVKVENTTDQVCNTLADISTLYLERLSSSIKQSAELSGRTQVCLEDVLNIFDEWGIDIEELSEEHILPYEPQLNGFNEFSSNPLNTPSSPVSVYEYFSRDANVEAERDESQDQEEDSHSQQDELSSSESIDYEALLKLDQPTNEESFLKCLPEKPQKVSQLKEIDTSVSVSSTSSLPTIPSQSVKPRKTTRSEIEDLSKPLETDSMHAIKRLCNKRSKIQPNSVKNFNDIVKDHDRCFLDMLADVKANCNIHEIERKNPLMEMNVIINQNQSNPDTHGLPYLPFFSPIDVLFQQNIPSITQSSFVSSVVPPMSRQEFLAVGTIPQPTWLQPSQPLSSPPAPPTPVKKAIRKPTGHSFTTDSPAPKIKLTFKNSTSPSEHDSRSLNDQPISPLPEAKHILHANSDFSAIKKAKSDGATPPAYQNGASSERINCICSRPDFDDGLFMISCDKCLEWFHGNCVGVFPHQELNSWYCERCINRKKEKAARRKAF